MWQQISSGLSGVGSIVELESGVRAEGKINTEQNWPLTTAPRGLPETSVAQPVFRGRFLLVYLHGPLFLWAPDKSVPLCSAVF